MQLEALWIVAVEVILALHDFQTAQCGALKQRTYSKSEGRKDRGPPAHLQSSALQKYVTRTVTDCLNKHFVLYNICSTEFGVFRLRISLKQSSRFVTAVKQHVQVRQPCWGFSPIRLLLNCKQSLSASPELCYFTYPQVGPAHINLLLVLCFFYCVKNIYLYVAISTKTTGRLSE